MRDTPGNRAVEQPNDRTHLRLRANVGTPEEFTVRTMDGVASPSSFRPPELRLLDALAETSPDTLLVTDANYGVIGVVMGAFADRVWMTETSARAATLCCHNAELNGVDDQTSVAVTADPAALPATFDVAAFAPTEYTPAAVVEQRMADTMTALDSDGELYLAAAPKAGLTRYERTLQDLCEDVSTIHDGPDCSIVRATRPSDFDPPRFAESRTIRPEINGTELELVTYPGLFSATGLDAGTRALAEHLTVTDGEHVLDLACGYGPLGIYAALTSDCTVSLTDDNRVATACARRSARRSNVRDRTDVLTADGVSGVRGESFDRIVCNPPTHAGSGVLQTLMEGASEVLGGDGRMNLVHHQGVPFDTYLEPYFDRRSVTHHRDYRIVTAEPAR